MYVPRVMVNTTLVFFFSNSNVGTYGGMMAKMYIPSA